MPIRFILTGGQEAECKQAIPLLENIKASAVLADKGYDTNELREWLTGQGIKTVIPPKSNRKEAIECDYWHYKERLAVECMLDSATPLVCFIYSTVSRCIVLPLAEKPIFYKWLKICCCTKHCCFDA
jgi:transposase